MSAGENVRPMSEHRPKLEEEMSRSQRRAFNPDPAGTVLLVQYSREADHFPGVPAALAARGLTCLRVNEHDADEITRLARHAAREQRSCIVVVKDTQSPLALYALRSAQAAGRGSVHTALLMDGIVEHRNTFRNPWVEADFLRPAPVDLVLAAGAADADRLASWGNRAIATGLPRLTATPLATHAAAPGRLMIATARRAAFSNDEFRVLLDALRVVQEEAERTLGADRIVWRLTEGLDGLLGVASDARPLLEALASVTGVLTTPSTLMIEAMLAAPGSRRRAVGLLHPWGCELWQQSPWIWRGDHEGQDSRSTLATIIRDLTNPTASQLSEQCSMLDALHGSHDGLSPAQAIAAALHELANESRRERPATARTLPRVARLPAPVPVAPGVRRIVNMVSVDGSPVGGVMSWAMRLASELPRQRPGYDVRTLAVVDSPEALWVRGFDIDPDGTTSLCVLDPMMDPHERVEHVRRAIEILEPSIILPNFNDVCFMAAMQARNAALHHRRVTHNITDVRVVTVAHTDTGYYRDLARIYDTFDAAVGVSAACGRWLRELARANPRTGADRPIREIVYGVPAAAAPRRPDASDPLRLCYVGRLVEEQKRVGLLWRVVEGLDRGDLPPPGFEFHIIGDGPELGRFAQQASARRFKQGRVFVHGRKSLAFVEDFIRGMDVSVLVSSYEGTSVTMLEAMGQGVVPCVTRVSSGVDEWVRDCESGVVVGIDAIDEMAPRLAELARNRDQLAAIGRRAWETVRSGTPSRPPASIAHMSAAYADLFDEVLALPPFLGGHRDCSLHPIDSWRWAKTWCDSPGAAHRWCERALHESGAVATHANPRLSQVSETCPTDAVLFTPDRAEPVTFQEIDAWRARGCSVAVSPMLAQDGLAARVLTRIREALANGRRRIAVYGTGHHTRRCRVLFEHTEQIFSGGADPFVGFIDDRAEPAGSSTSPSRCFGRRVFPLDDALREFNPDCILLSSDAFEKALWARTAACRERGIEVIALYQADSAGSRPLSTATTTLHNQQPISQHA